MTMKKRRISVLGSTGSIGRQALNLVAQHPERFEVAALSAHSQSGLLFEQIRAFRPKAAGLSGGKTEIPDDLKGLQWYFGEDCLERIASEVECEDVLVSVVGIAGLDSVISARKAGKRVLLANKEALVAGGQLVMDLCPQDTEDPVLIPVDSEHSAIYQCLLANKGNPFSKIILTASGGPFRAWTLEKIRNADKQEALNHPNWSMGQKITIDSASMFNKALEMIEAKWLFNAKPEQIEVIIHPQSIVHSLVEFKDGVQLAQLGVPDMRAPIAFAMAYPERISIGSSALRLDQTGILSFEAPDLARFPALKLSMEAMKQGGAAPCVLNAANEVAVDLFLREKIRFGDINRIVEESLSRKGHLRADSLLAVHEADAIARETALSLVEV